jgi:UDP-N-acetyl-D-galactosamine dehydrogenase
MIANGSYIKGARVNVLGLTFKENCADLRNSKVGDVISELRSYGVEVCVHDPYADAVEAQHEYGVSLMQWGDLPRADALILAVAHSALLHLGADELSRKLIRGGVVVDVKASLDAQALRAAGLRVWRL